jgi:hypothetical protein
VKAGRDGARVRAEDQRTGPRQRQSPFFATCPAGLGRILRDQLAGLPGVEVSATGSDGQADYVLFDADRGGRALAVRSRLAEHVLAQAGRASRAAVVDPAVLAGRCWRPGSVQRALSVWAEQVRPLSAGMTFSVTTRTRTGPRPLRAGLRGALTDAILRDRPRWNRAGQAELEIWLSEWRDGELVVGLRLGGNRAGQAAAFGPAVAAAMVQLAGEPDGVLLDPCCGTGIVLAEALAAGWAAEGTDTMPGSLAAARLAAPAAIVGEGDASEILEPDDSVHACVSGLGRSPDVGWVRSALAEMSRVTRSGGAVVVLAPGMPREVIPGALRLRQQVPVRLAAGQATMWVFRRA